jgi:hypothetical protein
MEATFKIIPSFYEVHVILKTTTRTKTLKGGGFGLTPDNLALHDTFVGETFIFELRVLLPAACRVRQSSPAACLVSGNTL